VKAWVLIGFLWVCYLLNHADRQVVYTLFPALQKEFGLSDPVLGLTGALFLWVYGFCSPFSGVLGDRLPKRHIVAGSLAAWSSLTALSGLAFNGAFLLTCRVFLGLSQSLFFPAASALIASAHRPESRSKAIAIFASSQLAGVAVGGSLSGYLAEQFHWRVSFWVLGLAGILFALPLCMFLSSVPAGISRKTGEDKATFGSFISLLQIPSLRIAAAFAAIATFGLFLVYTWLPTFLYDKFSLGLARAGFEASVYPQIGTLAGLLAGGAIADKLYRRTRAARFWVVTVGFFLAAPCIFWLGGASTVESTRLAAVAFGIFFGFIMANQLASSFDVVPAYLRASAVGVLNLAGATVSGFAPFLGGFARKTIGVGNLMGFTALLFLAASGLVLYGILRHFAADHKRVVDSAEAAVQPR